LTNIGASNGLLRQYFPKGSDLRAHDVDRLAAVADELNARPPQNGELANPGPTVRSHHCDPAPRPVRAS